MNDTVKDYVCQMQVSPDSFPAEYAGGHYAFCSAQCRERFLANPHLYIGFPGRKAPAQEGQQVIKHRRFRLSETPDAEQAGRVKEALLELMGMIEVSLAGDTLEIKYDLIQVTAEQIADKLRAIGTPLTGSWIDRLRGALVNNLEDIEINSLEVEKKKKCCH